MRLADCHRGELGLRRLVVVVGILALLLRDIVAVDASPEGGEVLLLGGVCLSDGDLVDEFLVGQWEVIKDGAFIVKGSHNSIAADDVDACVGVLER